MPEPTSPKTRVTIAGGLVVTAYRTNLRRSVELAVDASIEHGQAWLLDEKGAGVMFSHGAIQEELFGNAPWRRDVIALLPAVDRAAK